jgi:hypothetical protein
MKIFIRSILLFMVFLFLSGSVVYGKQTNQIELDKDDSPINSEALNDYLAIGNATIEHDLLNVQLMALACDDFNPCLDVVRRVSILGMTYYSQLNSTWKNDIMQSCGYTIGSSGCALTSYTMVVSKYATGYNPKSMNILLGTRACGLDWPNVASFFNLTYQNILHTIDDLSNSKDLSLQSLTPLMIGVLDQGRPLILGLRTINDKTHFIVVRAYTLYSDGSYIFDIYDPNSSSINKSLQSYFETGWKAHRIKVYYK